MSPVGRTQTAPDEPAATRAAVRAGLVQQLHRRLLHRLPGAGGARRPRLRAARRRLRLRVRQRPRPLRPGRPGRQARRHPGDRDGRPRGLPAAARAAQGRPGPAAGAPPAPLDHDLRRPRGRQQRLARAARRTTPPGAEGDFLARRREAYEAYLEWMPFRLPDQHTVDHQGTRFFKRFTFGRLGRPVGARDAAEPQRPGRRRPVHEDRRRLHPDRARRSTPQLADPDRHLPEPEQLRWLEKAVARQGRSWHLVGNQVIFTPIRFPGAALGLPAGDYLNSDQWDGYQADQAALIEHLDAHAQLARRRRRSSPATSTRPGRWTCP